MVQRKILPPKNEEELLSRGINLAGKTIAQLSVEGNSTMPTDLRRSKGWVGQLLEQLLGATAQSRPMPDFEYLGIELKTIPVNAKGKPIESTYVCSIPLCQLSWETWQTSLVRKKLSRVFWVPYEGDNTIPLAKRRVGLPILWNLDKKSEIILENDYKELSDMIAMGQVEEITGKMGVYLQVRPKAANSKALRKGLSTDGQLKMTLPRGFYLRSIFTEQILSSHYLF